MGDLMHALPALTDAQRNYPGITFDWVVDEAFAEVPAWHPSVQNIYKSAHRRWRKNYWSSLTGGEFSSFYKSINENNYDVIIDAQNNVKSSVISFLRKGKVHGMDSNSVAEQPAYLAYKYRHFIDRKQHAITRQRQLFASALDYDMPLDAPDYNIKDNVFIVDQPPVEGPFLFLVHNASWTTKLWPESYWDELIRLADVNGLQVVLPGGNTEELERAKTFASKHANAIALPRMSLGELGSIIHQAEGAICCDTGLAHLTAIIGTPAITLYGPTSIDLIGTSGVSQIQLGADLSDYPCVPCYKRQCHFNNQQENMSACMQALKPEQVWNKLKAML